MNTLLKSYPTRPVKARKSLPSTRVQTRASRSASLRAYEDWVTNGSKTMAGRAADRVEEILATHRTESLAPEAAKSVRAVVERSA